MKITLCKFAQLVSETNKKMLKVENDFEGRLAATQAWETEELGWNAACVPLLRPN